MNERTFLLIVFAVFVLASAPARAWAQGSSDVPEHHAADPSAVPVTERNLLESERFWPYHVALSRAWQPSGRSEPLAPGIAGVLIRVEGGGVARIDFGRDGLYEVPIAATDLMANAERVRRGELDKLAPNFVLDIGPRLVDSASEEIRPFGLRPTAEHEGFLCVFADPSAPGFGELAASLAPLRTRARVLSVLFPEGDHPDVRLREQLRALDWPIAFVMDHLAEAYARTLLPDGASPPALLLVTCEGRVLFQRRFEPSVTRELREVLDRSFGPDAPRVGSR